MGQRYGYRVFVFVDDSGDPGLDFANGASSHIVMSAIVVRDRATVEQLMASVAKARYSFTPDGQEIVYKREFKYSSCPRGAKDKFFKCMTATPYSVRAIIFDKRTIRSKHLQENPNAIKSYLIRQMLSNTLGTVREAKLIVDGDDTRAFGMKDQDYFMHMVNKSAVGTLSAVEFVDSKKSQGVQVADMTAGAIRKALTGDKAASRHETTFEHRYKYPHGSRWVLK